ncbi:MAG: hypothetical protein K2Y31_06380 [Burkholderiales bacterium]|jgi:hypothetical protein|nr:hypothetical protein [Burkholderiales bacterium]
MRYKKGHSGNPAGRPVGIRDKRTVLRAFLEPHAGDLIGKAIERALEGDTTALRICIDRLLPPVKAKDSPVELPSHDQSLADQGRAVLAALCRGEITPSEATAVMQAVAAQARIIEIDALDRRVSALEENANKVPRPIGS